MDHIEYKLKDDARASQEGQLDISLGGSLLWILEGDNDWLPVYPMNGGSKPTWIMKDQILWIKEV